MNMTCRRFFRARHPEYAAHLFARLIRFLARKLRSIHLGREWFLSPDVKAHARFQGSSNYPKEYRGQGQNIPNGNFGWWPRMHHTHLGRRLSAFYSIKFSFPLTFGIHPYILPREEILATLHRCCVRRSLVSVYI